MKNLIFAALLVSSVTSFTQTNDSLSTALTPKDRPINLYLLDYPLNFKDGYYFPSLNQSIYTTVTVQEVVNKSLGNALEPIHPV